MTAPLGSMALLAVFAARISASRVVPSSQGMTRNGRLRWGLAGSWFVVVMESAECVALSAALVTDPGLRSIRVTCAAQRRVRRNLGPGLLRRSLVPVTFGVLSPGIRIAVELLLAL